MLQQFFLGIFVLYNRTKFKGLYEISITYTHQIENIPRSSCDAFY
jgi:hypothetical protein